MLEAPIKEANETYDKVESILKGRPLPSWNAIRDKHVENIDAARAEYNSLQVVKNGKWYQKGEMGWWGMSNDEMSQDEWNRKFWEMINSLDPETELNLLNCHI